jgi:hypothetical protein
MKKIIGILLIAGAIGVIVPYTILTITFDYPDILRKDVGEVLTRFHAGGTNLIITWWLFAVLGLPMLVAYIQLGQLYRKLSSSISWITAIGVIGLVVQIVGLLRWTFVVPIIAANFVTGDVFDQKVSKVVFQVVHQYGGVVLGEHLGQLFTIIWMLGITIILHKHQLVRRGIILLGYTATVIYLLAQAELFATVISNFPVWDLAGFIGSTLWLVWLIALGTSLLFTKSTQVEMR